MKKFLVVGCGGSGAKTQAYMIDQLKAYLRGIDPTITSLPKAWQFVSIDVPVAPEKGPDGLSNVQANGGRYVGIGSKTQYRTFDAGLSTTLGTRGALGEIATWAPRHPESINTPVHAGAGQYRGLGRMLTLQSITRIRDELRSAMDVLQESGTIDELNNLNYRVTGRASENEAEPLPVIFVISSMAGGAGASMFLDVCRILSTIPNASPENTGVFMFTPEVFETLPADSMVGAWPNALAMFGEAVATQTGAATASDAALFEALGINATSSSNTFARLFPVGGRMGATGARFGDGSPNTIYRGLGRALAAMVSSEKSADSFVSYSLANSGGLAANRDYLGWADPDQVRWDALPWGSMGYAQLSMGRDRYAEYSAQRMARTSFDRILHGHLDPQSKDTGEEQLQKRLNDRYPEVLGKIGLSGIQSIDQSSIGQWIGWALQSAADPAVGTACGLLRQRLPSAAEGQKAGDWSATVRVRLTDAAAEAELRAQLDDTAYAAVRDFADRFCDMVTAVCEEYLASVSLPFVEKVVDKLAGNIRQNLVSPMAALADSARSMRVTTVPTTVDSQLEQFAGNGAVTNSGQTLTSLVEKYRPQFHQFFCVRVADYLAPVLEDFLNDALGRLSRELRDAHADLEHSARAKSVSLNLADTATDDPVAWPKDRDETVNDRFRGSANEILITDVDQFPRDYVTHLVQDVQVEHPEVMDARAAAHFAARDITLGRWQSSGSVVCPNDTLAPAARLVGNRAGWVSTHLSSGRGAGDDREPRPGAFSAKIHPAQLLERSRMWIRRPEYHFSRFIDTDLRSYMTQDETTNDSTFDARVQRLRSAFSRAIDQARPLAAVDNEMVRLVHNKSTEYHFNFSEIPLKGKAASDVLDSVLNQKTGLDDSTGKSFDDALTQSDKVRHIDVFGSYPNYSPVVFSSLFPAIAKDRDSRPNFDGYWNLRRSRPVAATVPLTQAERQAMVAGWLIGTFTGRIYIQDEGSPEARVHIWDDTAREWVAFPHPLLTPPQEMRAKIDWMPAVIESVLIAYADIQERDARGQLGGSLRPYRLLRELYDNHPESPTRGATDHSAAARIADFLTSGERPGQDPVGTGIRDRHALFQAQLDHATKNATYFLPGRAGLPGSRAQDETLSRVTSRAVASEMPLYRDLAADVDVMTRDLRDRLAAALHLAEHPVTDLFSGAHAAAPQPAAPDTPVMPDFGSDLF